MERIYREVADEIAACRFQPGHRLPSVRRMAARHSVSRDTVLRAYDKLVAAGLVQVERGSGFYVANRLSALPPRARAEDRDLLDWMQLIHSDRPLERVPGSGVLRHEDGSQAEIVRVLRSVVANASSYDGGYANPMGYLPVRQQFQAILRLGGVDPPIENIVTAPGALAGVGLAVRALIKPGNVALVEDPCSFAHVQLLLAQGAQIRQVPRLPDGPDIDVLRELCELHRPALFIVSSLLHNPTSTSIALHKAQQLVELAAEYAMPVIDDCSYADLLPTRDMPPAVPLILLDRLRNVVHVGGYSHMVTPEAGPAYIVAGEAQMRYIRVYRLTLGLCNMTIAERTLYRLLSEGIYRRRCDRIRTHVARCSLSLRQLWPTIGLSPPQDRSGLFQWISLGASADSLAVAKRMLAKGYLTAPAKHFTLSPERQHYMRFNVTTCSPMMIEALRACL